MKLLVKFYLLFSCFTVLQHGSSQNLFPPAYQLTTDTISTITLPVSNWQYVEDVSTLWTIDSVRKSSIADKFHSNTPESRSSNDYMYNFWVRFRLKNTMNREVKLVLPFLSGRKCEIYLFDSSGKERHFVNGLIIPWSKKDGVSFKNPYIGSYLPISILAGTECDVYLREIRAGNFGIQTSKFAINLLSIEKMKSNLSKFEEEEYLPNLKSAVFFGILLWVSVFNIFFFSIVKERIYLYFALYVFLLGFGIFTVPMYNLFFTELPSTFNFLTHLGWGTTAFVLTFFIRNLLKTYFYFPAWDKWLLIINASTLIYGFSYDYFILPSRWASILRDSGYLFSTTLYFSLLITLLLSIQKTQKSNHYMMFVLLPAFGTWIIFHSLINTIPILERRFGMHHPFYYDWLKSNWWEIERVCLLTIVLYFSWVLLENFNVLRKQVVQKELEKEIERSQLIEQQKIELEKQVTERTSELSLSLKNLTSTQSQLIQSEKLASLGELTAGIAHEIQNPLNFVNNFAKLSVDLAQDINSEIHQPEIDKDYVEELLTSLSSNQEKISHHGNRAAIIVKGMIEHSKPNTGVRELTDINKLCDEYSRLSFNSLKAKNPDFKVEMIAHFDESLPKIEIVPQDIGRVVVNLVNNAFYAVNERNNLVDFENLRGYKPTVTVTTQKTDNTIEIRIKDNGTGMSEAVRAKVFQPFFTTKPTGSGTGLGLSLAYDIITKGHGGTLKAESAEGVGSEFVITLPY